MENKEIKVLKQLSKQYLTYTEEIEKNYVETKSATPCLLKVIDLITRYNQSDVPKKKKNKTMFGSPDGYGMGYNQAIDSLSPMIMRLKEERQECSDSLTDRICDLEQELTQLKLKLKEKNENR